MPDRTRDRILLRHLRHDWSNRVVPGAGRPVERRSDLGLDSTSGCDRDDRVAGTAFGPREGGAGTRMDAAFVAGVESDSQQRSAASVRDSGPGSGRLTRTGAVLPCPSGAATSKFARRKEDGRKHDLKTAAIPSLGDSGRDKGDSRRVDRGRSSSLGGRSNAPGKMTSGNGCEPGRGPRK